MAIKSIIGATCVCLAVVSFNVSAISIPSNYIDNGGYTTNKKLGLDWLDLSYTFGVAYNDASNAVALVEGGGWTYATNEQVNTLFNDFFPDWTASDLNGTSSGQLEPNLAFGIDVPEIEAFHELFNGSTWFGDGYEFNVASGLYRDELDILRMMGTSYVDYTDIYNSDRYSIAGPDYYEDFDVYADNMPISRFDDRFGMYLVRDVSAVPIPATAWLFGSGIIGLIGFARRKA